MYKDKEKVKQYRLKHYLENRLYYIYKAKKYKQNLKKWYYNEKSKYSCKKCGETHIPSLEFHHRDPSTKVMAISAMVGNGYSKKRILEEIKKCDCLCPTCHRKLIPSPIGRNRDKSNPLSYIDGNFGLPYSFFWLNLIKFAKLCIRRIVQKRII